jgi:hypothetical protein
VPGVSGGRGDSALFGESEEGASQCVLKDVVVDISPSYGS